MPGGLGTPTGVTNFGSVNIIPEVLTPIEVTNPILLRFRTGAGTAQLPFGGRVSYAFGSFPSNDSGLAIPATNGDCYLSTPGTWYVLVEHGTSTFTAPAFYTADKLDMASALFGDLARTGCSKIIQQALYTVPAAGIGGQRIAQANKDRKLLFVSKTTGGVVGCYLRLGDNTFGAGPTFNGHFLSATAGSAYQLSGDSMWWGDVYAGGDAGNPIIYVLELGN